MTTGEESVAGAAEPLPDRLLATARHRPDGLPLVLQRLQRLGGRDPVGGVGECLGLFAQHRLLREVLGTLGGLHGEVRLAAGPHLVVGGLEAAPERIGLGTRHVGRRPPLLLQLTHFLGSGIEVFGGLERFHPGAELLLDGDVGEALPVVGLAQFLHLRRERGLHGLEPRHDVLEVLLGRQRRHRPEGILHVLQRAVGGLQREVVLGGKRLDAAEQIVHASQRLLAGAGIFLARLGVAPAHAAGRVVVARQHLAVHVDAKGGVTPFAAHRVEALARRLQVLVGGGRFGLDHQFSQPAGATLAVALQRLLLGGFARGTRVVCLGRCDRFDRRGRRLNRCVRSDRFSQGIAVRRCRHLSLRRFNRPCGHCCGHGGRGGRLRCLARGTFIGLAHVRTCPLRRALVPAAQLYLFELGAVGDEVERGQRRILEIAVHRDGQELVVRALLANLLERTHADRLERRMTRDRGERVHVHDAGERARRRGFAGGRLRNLAEYLRIGEGVDRLLALRFADFLERLEREVAQHRRGLGADAVVLVLAQHHGQRRRVH